MRKKMIWGLAILIILLIGVSVFLLTQAPETEPETVYNPLSSEEEEQVKYRIQDAVEKSKIPINQPKDKLVQHGDHHHEVSISSTNSTEGGLTYHAELLETNPVKALRLQAKERGHWSRDHIPPFPPDDTEAQEFARNRYLMHYYESIGYGSGNLEPENFDPESNRIYGNAVRAYLSQMDAFEQYPSGARPADLARITWTNLEAGYIRPYGGMTRYGRARLFPSDYFPDFIDVPK